MKIVINRCYGGFGLSDKAIERLLELGYDSEEIRKDKKYENNYNKRKYWGLKDITRDNPLLIQVVEELGSLADGDYSQLKIVEIPDDVEWEIEEYDGIEWVAEKHRTWE